MSEAVLQTIELVRSQIAELESQLAEKRRMVNSLCALIGEPEVYAVTDEKSLTASAIRNDEFYGQPLSTVVRSILEMRKIANLGAASVGEIYDAMLRGGFSFGSANPDNAKRSLRISLTKNSAAFHRLPNGKYGLLEWYPNAKAPKAMNGGRTRPIDDVEAEVESEDESREFQAAFDAAGDSSTDKATIKPH